ncbi:MAG TPA: hypothetical protein VF676_06865 [Flavobacterium sp.]|jgi:hypothetical protein
MELTSEHIAAIRDQIEAQGVTLTDLSDSLLDHICCVIENDPEDDFHLACANAFKSFGANGIKKVEDETIIVLTSKSRIMKKIMFLLGYVAAALISTGMLFKIQHWPAASILLTVGIVVLNFGFLPMYFHDRYKRAMV